MVAFPFAFLSLHSGPRLGRVAHPKPQFIDVTPDDLEPIEKRYVSRVPERLGA
jgi:hypothetical protein